MNRTRLFVLPAVRPAARVAALHPLVRAVARPSSTCPGSSCPGGRKTGQPPSPPPSMASLAFWQSRAAWGRAGVNTLRCLVGCSLGDFAAMWYLQTHHADWGVWPAIVGASVASGLATSVALETVLLRVGRDGLSWPQAARTAVGMSFISMITMEVAENAVDLHLTGGTVALHDPMFWAAAAASMAAGYLAPLPYNYARLRRYGRSCH